MIYEGALTNQFKEIIIDELYDTGALYESIEIFSYETPGFVYFDVQCEEYIVYHIERLDLLNRLAEMPEFQEAYEKYIANNLESSLQQSLESADAPDANINSLIPQCFILVNGI